MIAALHANGNLGGEELENAVNAMQEQFNSTRQKIVMGSDFQESDVEQFVADNWWKK